MRACGLPFFGIALAAIGPAIAQIQINAVVNAASYTANVAPGSLATIFGTNLAGSTSASSVAPLPTSVGGTSVMVNGSAAPLLYVSPTQINLQIPYEIPLGPAGVIVSSGGASSAEFGFTVAPSAPGIFRFGTNRAVAQNQDYSLNYPNNPAGAGSVAIVYLTGIGAVDNRVPTGAAAPPTPLSRAKLAASATIAGQDALIQFVGLAPAYVGLAQANITVPPLPVGDYPLVITIGGADSNNPHITAGAATKVIAQIQVSGQPVKVFDHTTDKQEPYNIPDAQITAWREADGTVDLLVPHLEAYRMRGPDLEHLAIDPHKIYSSTQSGSQIPEDMYNYHNWLMGAYSLDGVHFYSLAHSEWYACLLNGDCNLTGANGLGVTFNSWENTVNSFVSADGGASWQLNVVAGNHAVARTGYHWTGSEALADKIYLHALNSTGMFQPTRIIKERDFYYAISFHVHRDFSQIDPAHGVYEAPVDKYGYVLMRTSDVTNPNGWQGWTSGGTYEPISDMNFSVFLPQQNGTSLNAAPMQIIFDVNAQCYMVIFTIYSLTSCPGAIGCGSNAVYYMTTKSLANPSWSPATPILGTAQLVTDPSGPVEGFNDGNYPSILDSSSSGFNFEFTTGSPYLFWSTFPGQYGGDNLGRDVFRVQLSVTYQ